MSMRKTKKGNSPLSKTRIQDIEMVEPENNENDNILNNEQLSSRDIITTDVSLRNLFHVGHNSKSLTKSIINSIKFEEVITMIKNFIENDELSVKSCGPLILGLSRVYEKQIKIYLEDLMTMFEIKTKKKSEDKDTINLANKSKKYKQIVDKESINDELKSNYTDQHKKTASFFNSANGNNILSLSPLNEGIFSLLNNDPKSKFTSDSKIKSPSMIEAFRAQNSAEIDSKSRFNINSNMNSNFKQPIMENSLFEEEENNDVNNFFQFITENIRTDINSNLNGNGNGESAILDYNIESGINNLEEIIKNKDEVDKLIFPSESKTLFNVSGLLKKVKIDHKIKKVNVRFEYDNEININLDEANSKLLLEETNQTLSKFKSQLRFNEEINFPGLLLHKNTKLFEKNEFNLGQNENYIDNNLINNFSNLDMGEFNFSEVEFREKINKILEEEKKTEDHEEKDLIKPDFEPEEINQIHDVTEDGKSNSILLKSNDAALNDFAEKVQQILKKKKKNISLIGLKEKLYDNVKDTTNNTHEMFYNVLCLAQKDSININQKNIFDNESILISLKN